MFRWRRRMAAVLALAALASPGLAAGLVALHLAHHHDDPVESRDLAVAFHGHGHPDGTVEHDHPLVLTGVPHATRPPQASLLAVCPGVTDQLRGNLAGVAPLAAPLRYDHGPPGPPGAFAILRV
ncbi:MAG TPA: hypothetical protein VLI67_12060 [Vicinamibacteria bacterium]|nr:hypothetical protein [Vicinamibacteria bacterium]